MRDEYEAVLFDVADQCCVNDVFKSPVTIELIDYVRHKYCDELEFLWPNTPNNAIWRRKDNKKWYAAVLTVERNRLGIDSNELIEIINLKAEPAKLTKLLLQDHFYPGWHMNKKHWFSVILDGSVEVDYLKQLLDHSYLLAGSK